MSYRLSILLPAFLTVYAASYCAAFLVRFEFQLDPASFEVLRSTLPLVLLIRLTIAVASREWQRRFRYTSLNDLLYVAMTTVAATVVLGVLNELRITDEVIPRSVIAIDCGSMPIDSK